jgi:hypothetical protein
MFWSWGDSSLPWQGKLAGETSVSIYQFINGIRNMSPNRYKN